MTHFMVQPSYLVKRFTKEHKSQTDGGDLGDLDDDELLEDFNLSEDTFDSE